MLETPQTVAVYRVENPNIPATPNNVTSHEELVGRWFSPDIDSALRYLRKSTRPLERGAAPVDGAQLVIAHVPADQLEALHVTQHPIAATMDVENDNYIVPRDGSIPTDVISLDEALGDLRGKLGNLNIYQAARQRVHALLGAVAIEK